MRTKGPVLVALLLAATLVVPPAFGAGEGTDSDWQFNLAPLYLWAANIDGSVGTGPANQEVKADFGNIFDNLEMVFTVHFEAEKGSWGGIVDVNYLNVGNKAGLPGGGEIDLDLQNTILEFDGFYRIRRDAHTFDLLAGLRYTDQDTKITLPSPFPQANIGASWWDPIVGGRWMWNFADKWAFIARGDIGGFGVGSDFTWNASGIFVWQPWKHVALAFGYRVLDQDYEDGEGLSRYKWDATLSGPIGGINFTW